MARSRVHSRQFNSSSTLTFQWETQITILESQWKTFFWRYSTLLSFYEHHKCSYTINDCFVSVYLPVCLFVQCIYVYRPTKVKRLFVSCKLIQQHTFDILLILVLIKFCFRWTRVVFAFSTRCNVKNITFEAFHYRSVII